MNKQRLEQKQYQSLSPQQIQFLGLLQIPIVSLEKRIEQELEENPALDEDEQEEENQNPYYSSSPKPNFEDFQMEDKTESLEDHLRKQLVDLNLTADILFLVKYLINSLDDNGFLSRDLYAISSDLLTNNNMAFSENDLQLALKILKDLDPIGVGAENLQDCLLIQLRKLHPSQKVAFQIISEYYTPFSNKNFERILKDLSLSEKELKAIYHLIEKLNPFPAAGFSKNTAPAEYIYPDFTIIITNNQLQLQLNNGNTKTIKVSKYYSDLLLETKDRETKEFLIQKVERAKWFKESWKNVKLH
ncbi:MAG: hypothetical protein ABR81_04715 [Cryomorphaceae bacterium BACL11 MAG-121128-bin16]|nr:MAG: hypothetical protein ABR81_04715 [Cryomorphaceae bacterium BACL11 MAG-121128-bin16]